MEHNREFLGGNNIFGFAIEGGKHPGPPPPVPAFLSCECKRMRFVYRYFQSFGEWSPATEYGPVTGEAKHLRYGYQCKDCGCAIVPTGWLGPKKSLEYHQQPLSEAAWWGDAFTRKKAAEREAAYWNRREQKRTIFFEWYNQYLQSRDWRVLRDKVFSRDGRACRRCGAVAEQVHHITYARVGYEELDDLVAVCRQCHDEIHGQGR